jgi:hypothetical protein
MDGLHADIETLAVLHECGMQFSDTVVRAAALSGRLDVLQNLITCNASVRRPTGSAITLLAAAASACSNGLERRLCANFLGPHAQKLQKAVT